ncbi:IclR family transcriptional regulator [Aeromicrobium endophyticum]|uniref:IclR family transcriptional regulator n=1 Tax=Aeromicrobium endophyticum TaxID=2292704 RepID=A0A371NZ31_9ACTN|nr:IclR family transcriptional regulator [Aeromicrobium endophyticum]
MSGTVLSGRTSGRPAEGEPLIGRAFRVLGAFSHANDRLSLATLSVRANLPKSTALRIAAQLVEVGALERGDDGKFVVGLRLLEIAALAPRGHGLRAAALPYMQDLEHVTRQHVLLAVRDHDEAVLVERLSSRDATPVKYRIGGRLPLGATGVGLALLAYAPDDVRASVLGGDGSGERDSLSRRRIRQLLASARGEGVLTLTGPNPVSGGPGDITTIAAPILDGRGGAMGAISLVSPGRNTGLIGHRLALRTASLAIARAAGRARGVT